MKCAAYPKLISPSANTINDFDNDDEEPDNNEEVTTVSEQSLMDKLQKAFRLDRNLRRNLAPDSNHEYVTFFSIFK